MEKIHCRFEGLISSIFFEPLPASISIWFPREKTIVNLEAHFWTYLGKSPLLWFVTMDAINISTFIFTFLFI